MAIGLKIDGNKYYVEKLKYEPCSDSYTSSKGSVYVYNRKNTTTNTYQFATWKSSAYSGNVELGKDSVVYKATSNPSNAPMGMSSGYTIEDFTYYKVTVESGQNCSLTVTWNASTNSGISSRLYYVDEGSKIKIKAVPYTDYRFVSWTGSSETSNELEIIPSSDITITSNVALNPRLVTNISGTGSVNRSGWASGQRFVPGTSKTATAVESNSTYRFLRWEKNGSPYSYENTCDLVVGNTDTTYTAVFVSKYHQVSSSANGGNGVVELFVNGESVGKGVSVSASNVLEGTTCTIVSTPGTNYTFSSWSVDGIPYTNNSVTFIVGSSNSSNIACISYYMIRQSFALSVTKENPSLGSVKITGPDGWSCSEDGSGSISTSLYCGLPYEAIATVSDSRTPSGRLLNEFVGWYKNNVRIGDGTSYGILQDSTASIALVAKFAPKTLYSANVVVSEQSRGEAHIEQDADSVVGGVNKWLNGTISVVANPAEGFYVTSFNVLDADGGQNGFVSAGTKNDDGSYTMSFTLSFNATINVNFSRIQCRVTCGIDALSSSASAGTVSSNADTTPLYGEVVTFSASPKTSNGFSFSGWYSEDGSPMPDSVIEGVSHQYTETDFPIRLSGDVSVIGRFSAIVSVSASPSSNGFVSIDGSEGDSEYSKYVEIGAYCTISATPSADRSFNGWYASSDSMYDNPLDIEQSDSIRVLSPVSYVARIISSADYVYVALCNIDNDTESGDYSLGILSLSLMSNSSQQAEEISMSDFLSSTSTSDTKIGGFTKAYKIIGTKKCIVNASPAMGRGFLKWTREYTSLDGSSITVSQTAQFSSVIAKSCILRAYWGDPKPVKVEACFSSDSSIVNGNVKLIRSKDSEDPSSQIYSDDFGASGMFVQGSIACVSVDIKNGYLFDGWYYDSECNYPVQASTVDGVTYLYKDAMYMFTVASPIKICAKFVKDRNAIYKWEGSSERKMAIWKSKVYTLPRPLDMSTVRIDADKYPVTVSVGEHSSPDTTDTSSKTINVTSQNMRRLPYGRCERYVQIKLSSNGAINFAAVGTNSVEV